MSDKISKNVSYKEATRTSVKLDNTPTKAHLNNMKIIAKEIFEPLRKGLGNNPIKINSFYRRVPVNKIIGGSSRSQHCKGMAIDMDGIDSTNAELFFYILDNLDFDQLIWEKGDSKQPDWVHVSYRSDNPSKNRKQALVLRDGSYMLYSDTLCERYKAKAKPKAESKAVKKPKTVKVKAAKSKGDEVAPKRRVGRPKKK